MPPALAAAAAAAPFAFVALPTPAPLLLLLLLAATPPAVHAERAVPRRLPSPQTINDWYDRDIDAINEPYRPIPSGVCADSSGPGTWCSGRLAAPPLAAPGLFCCRAYLLLSGGRGP